MRQNATSQGGLEGDAGEGMQCREKLHRGRTKARAWVHGVMQGDVWVYIGFTVVKGTCGTCGTFECARAGGKAT